MLIALTGGIGSGKTTVSDMFKNDYKITVVDADEIARQVVTPGQPALKEIENRFGQTVINKDGTLNRSQLRSIVFNDNDEKKWLEALLHPKIKQKSLSYLENSQSPYAINVIPLLAETGRQKDFDRILVVDLDEQEQLIRTQKRDNIDKDQALKIIESQATREQRLKIADDIITNDGDKNNLKLQVEKLHQLYLKIAKQS